MGAGKSGKNRLKIIQINIMLVQMKKLFIYINALLLVAAGFLLSSCNNPAPTELVQDNSSTQNQVQYEVITKDPTDTYYSNGYDTTGVTTVIPPNINFINVSGAKVTENNSTRKISFAQAIFADKSHPVMGPGGRFLGYRTSTPGMLMFNGITADSTPYRIKFSYLGNVLDSLMGNMFLLNHQFNFNYNSQVHVQYYAARNMRGIPIGKPIDFYVPTPIEINGTVKVTGHLANKSLSGEVEWNRLNPADSVDLILGAVSRQGSTFPLFKIRTLDKGKLVIPSKLLNGIPSAGFTKLVFTFVRRIKITHSEHGQNLFVLSQSIHSIIIDIP